MQNRLVSAGLLGLRERPVQAHGSNNSGSLHNATLEEDIDSDDLAYLG
jgi:hypothetical protein